MKRSVQFLALLAGVVGASVAHARPPAGYDALAEAPAVAAKSTLTKEVARARAVIASMDEKRGVPSFLWATGAHPAQTDVSAAAAARSHVVDFARIYDLSPAALAAASVTKVHDTGRGGIIVTLQQRMGGAEVMGSEMKVLMRRNLELVAISGSLDPHVSSSIKPGLHPFRIEARHASAVAFGDLVGLPVMDDALSETSRGEGGYARFDLVPTGEIKAQNLRFTTPARAKKVWYRMADELVAAYFVEVHAGKTTERKSDYYRYVIAADDARVLQRQSLTAYDAYGYRVWADDSPIHMPLAGPQEDFLPHPTGLPDGSGPAFIPPSLIVTEGFNTNPNGQVDPWLPMGATQTAGNNVDAYGELAAPDGYSNGDLRPIVTSPGVFDRTYDTSLEPGSSPDQIMAGATQAFYLMNWLHDWWYDSGFDEAAGNAQQDNYGRGGLAGDRVEAHLQDAVDTSPYNYNNAFMSTPGDGSAPHMHNFLWTGADAVRMLDLSPGGVVGEIGVAQFGPSSYDVTAPVVLVDDGVNTVTDGCEPVQNNVAGAIALIDRGTCNFDDKVAGAEAAGAVGVLIANHTAGAGVFSMGAGSGWPVTIPAVMISFEDGVALKDALGNGPVTAHLVRQPGPERDGALDNMVNAHEWMHYMHMRLATGIFVGDYQGWYISASEGYADFDALHMVVQEDDDLDGTYAMGIYAVEGLAANIPYWGIRRQPYSVDFEKNGLTFRHISDGEELPASSLASTVPNSEGHNAGEVWGTMLFEGYVALLKQTQDANPPYDFYEGKRRVSDYLVAGMKLSPDMATYAEARDAIIAAALANDPADALVLAEAFARRGLGSCAISPERYSASMQGVVESFELAPMAQVAQMTITPPSNCDDDAYLDANELGTLSVVVRNGGMETLSGASLEIGSETAGVSFPAGATASIPDIEPLGSHVVELDVELDDSFTDIQVIDVDATVTSAEACESVTVAAAQIVVNADDLPAVSATDTAESRHEVWTKTGEHAGDIWGRAALTSVEHVWQGMNYGMSESDTQLESPDLIVSDTDPFVVSFDHAYWFEYGFDGSMYYFDGGVIELSEDGGQSWVDVSDYVDPGYDGELLAGWGNVLGGRMGFGAQSSSWPSLETLTLDLGSAFAGKTVRLRFRIGTDINTGAPGWFIDNIAFSGITNTPFGVLVPDDGECGPSSGCGNGVIDGNEQCDDGLDNNDVDPNKCRTNCLLARCGDGVIDTGEQCDDAGRNSDSEPDACRPGCVMHRCGDGVVDANEDCDDGMYNSYRADACRPTCAAPRCGDGVRDFGEPCDDGNGINGDLCTNDCALGPMALEDGSSNQGGAPAAPATTPPKVEAEGCGCRAPGDRQGRRGASAGALLALGIALASRRRKERTDR